MYKKIALALCATVFVAQACDIECNRSNFIPGGSIVNFGGISKEVKDYYNFRCKLMEACSHYVGVINALPAYKEKLPSEPKIASNDLYITQLRKVAVEFQDLQLLHDLMVGFSSGFRDKAKPADMLLQNALKEVSTDLFKTADSEENIMIHGYEVATWYSPRSMAEKLVKSFEEIVALHGRFAPVIMEVLERILKPYVAACVQLNANQGADMQLPTYTEEPILVEETNSNQPSVDVVLE